LGSSGTIPYSGRSTTKLHPLLAQANRTWFAVQIQDINGQIHTSGDVTLSFPLMSAIKPFMLLFLLERLGAEAVFARRYGAF